MSYVIFTDSACDIEKKYLDKWDVRCISLTLSFEDDGKELTNDQISPKAFYDKMRAGGVARTAAINAEAFKQAFCKELDAGNDILYVAFSSGLSTTCNSGRIAAEELRERYPDRKVLIADTLSASAGFGLLLYLTVKKRDGGASLEKAAEFIENTRLHLCHWFTVDDLQYLKRGGRVSPAVAFVGGLLGIKPVLHVDNEGRLINMSKVRGRKAAIKALADKYGELAADPSAPVFISHGDCRNDAEELADMMKSRYGVGVKLICDIGPVIGAHSGPGTLALFFLGKER